MQAEPRSGGKYPSVTGWHAAPSCHLRQVCQTEKDWRRIRWLEKKGWCLCSPAASTVLWQRVCDWLAATLTRFLMSPKRSMLLHRSRPRGRVLYCAQKGARRNNHRVGLVRVATVARSILPSSVIWPFHSNESRPYARCTLRPEE